MVSRRYLRPRRCTNTDTRSAAERAPLGQGPRSSYRATFSMLDDALSGRAKAQLAAEVIFLTHSEELHEVNLGWHPKGEGILWRPDLQEHKTSQASSDRVLRYRKDLKRPLVAEFEEMLAERVPYCRVRYAF